MKIRKFSYFFLFGGFCLVAGPPFQSSSASQEAVQLQKPLQHEVSVTLKLIQVYVTDKKGKPAEDLEKANFVVFDNGVQKKITEFEKHFPAPPEVKIEDAKPSPPRDLFSLMVRKFLFIFDYDRNDIEGVAKSKSAALHFIDTQIQPGEEIAVFSVTAVRGLALREYWTADHQKIRNTIKNMQDIPAVPVKGIPYNFSGPTAQGMEYWDLFLSTRDRGVPASVKLREFPSQMQELAKALQHIPGQKNIILFSRGFGRNIFDPRSISRGFFLDMSKALASANSPVFSVNTTTGMDKFTWPETSLENISKMTGGKYYGDVNYYSEIAKDIQNSTNNYYILGYYIEAAWDGKYHKIKVGVNKKGYDVHTQAGYFNPKPFREYSSLEKELHLFDLALTERPLLQIPLRFTLAPLSYAAGEEIRLEIIAKIPDAVIQKFLDKKVELISLVFDEKENLIGLQRTEAELKKYRGLDVFYTSGALLPPGQYKCRLVIRDLDTGDAAVASASVHVTQKPSVGLSLYSPLLLVQESNFAYLEGTGAKKEEEISWKEAYPYDRAQYSPIIGEAPTGTAKLYGVVPCSFAGIFLPDITLTAYLINSSSGQKIPITLSILNKSRKADIEIQFVEFSLTNVPPGKYLLYLHAEETGTKFVSYTQTPLMIK